MAEQVARNNLRWIWLSAIVIVLDQVIKLLVTKHLSYGQPIEILPFFNLILAHNTGAAFSFLSSAGGWQKYLFATIAIIVSIVIVIWMSKLHRTNNWTACALSLVLGGALGNLIDRVVHGYVIDFIQLHYHQYYWPDFNVADSAITVGAIMLIVALFRKNS